MSQHNHHHDVEAAPQRDPDPADSRADVVAAFAAVAIAVLTMIFFVSHH